MVPLFMGEIHVYLCRHACSAEIGPYPNDIINYRLKCQTSCCNTPSHDQRTVVAAIESAY